MVRTYKANLEKGRSGLSGEQIRQSKNARTKARNLANATARREASHERVANWQSLTPTEQLRDLDRRLGPGKGAVKQRKRIQAALDGQK